MHLSPCRSFVAALTLLLPWACGCGAAPAVPKAVAVPESVQKIVTNPVETIKPMVQPAVASSLDWELAGPLKSSGCYAAIDAVPGRPAVLRISTYSDPSRETFPSVMIWGQVGATTPAALVNQQVKAQAFAMRAADGAVWQTPPGQWITITITGAAEKSITGKIEPNSSLIDTSNNSQVPVSGTFTATLQ
jgi:hypothetical protein